MLRFIWGRLDSAENLIRCRICSDGGGMVMKVITKLSVMQDVALVTLNKVPANVEFVCQNL